MKKNVVAILMSFVLAAGSVGGISVQRAETGATSAVAEAEIRAEAEAETEADAGTKAQTEAAEAQIESEIESAEAQIEAETEPATETEEIERTDSLEETVLEADIAEEVTAEPACIEEVSVDFVQEEADEQVSEETDEADFDNSESESTESEMDTPLLDTNDRPPAQNRLFQDKVKIWKYDNRITIVYDSPENIQPKYSLYRGNSEELLYTGNLKLDEDSSLYYETVNFDELNSHDAENNGDEVTVNIKDIPVRVVLNDGSNKFEEIVSTEIDSVAIMDAETVVEGQVVLTWNAAENVDGYSVLVHNSTVRVYETEENRLSFDIPKEGCVVLVAPYRYILNSTDIVKLYGEASFYNTTKADEEDTSAHEQTREDAIEETSVETSEQDTVPVADARNLTMLENIDVIFGNDLIDSISLEALEEAILYGNCNNLTWTMEDNVLTISGTGEMTSNPGNFNSIPFANYFKSDFAAVIEYGVTSIMRQCFLRCDHLVSISIPSSVVRIGGGAFYDCSGLKNISIPSSVTKIEDSTFFNCTNLKNVTIPYGVTEIGNSAFYGCTGLTSVSIPSSVTCIGDNAFKGCKNLSSITLSTNIASIGKDAFAGTPVLNSMGDFLVVNGILIGYQGSSTDVTIPSEVTGIGNGAFYGNNSITDVTIPESVTSIGDGAFSGCSSLAKIVIPTNVASIGNRAFYNCSSLAEVTIPDSVIRIGDESFTGTPWIKTQGDTIVLNNLLMLYQGAEENIVIPDGVTEIGDNAFNGCTGIVSVTIPSSVTSIGAYAFSNCSDLVNITIPSSVKKIGRGAFSNCTSLESVKIPMGVESIEPGTFSGCTSLSSVKIPSSVTSIGDTAFRGCSKLTDVIIPNKVERIGLYAFSECNSLESVIIPRSVKEIESYSFSSCRNLAVVTILNGVNGICSEAFNGCSSLKSVKIPSSMINIGNNAFYGCTGIKDVYYEGDETAWGMIYKWDTTMQAEEYTLHCNSRLTGSIDLSPEFSCIVGETISITAVYNGGDAITSVEITSDAEDGLLISDVSFMEPVAAEEDQRFYQISFTVTGVKEGEYGLTLTTSDGASESTVITVTDNKKYDIADAEISMIYEFIDDDGMYCYSYTGNPVAPVYSIKMSNKKVLEKDKDYTLIYENNTEIGTARCILEGIGDYHGQKIVEFLIVPVKPSFESVESEFPGSCTAVINTLSKPLLYKIDVQKDGKSIDGYPQEVGDVATEDGGTATNSFTEYIDHLEEGETYKIRICAIAKIGGKNYQSEWDESDEKILAVKLTPENGFKTAESNCLLCSIDFGSTIKLTGNGYAELHDAGSGNVIERIELSSSINSLDSYVVINPQSVLNIRFSNNTRTRDVDESNSSHCTIQPDHKYYITISDNAVIDEKDKLIYGGFNNPNKWNLETIDASYPIIENFGEVIPKDLYDQIFKPVLSFLAYKHDDGSGGTCYGLSYSALKWNSDSSFAGAFGNISSMADVIGSSSIEGTTFKKYCQIAQVLQYKSSIDKQKKSHANKYTDLYNAVKNGENIIIGVHFKNSEGETKGHALYPICINPNNEDEILVFDCNRPPREEIGNRGSFIHTLKLLGNGRSYAGWEYFFEGPIGTSQGNAVSLEYTYPGDLFSFGKDDDNIVVTNKSLSSTELIRAFSDKLGTEEMKDQPDADGKFCYWTEENSISLSSMQLDEDGYVSITDGYRILEASAEKESDIILDLDKMTATVVPEKESEAQAVSLGYVNYTDYDDSTKIDIIATGSEQVILTKTDEGWSLEGADPGTITIALEATGIDDSEEKTITSQTVVETSTGNIDLKEDDNRKLHVYEDADGDGSRDEEIGSVEIPCVMEGLVAFGTCGENLEWVLDKKGVLTISGTGAMDDYTKSPWSEYSVSNVVIDNGVTGIGNYAFNSCRRLSRISIPSSLENIGRYAFLYTASNKKIQISDLEAWLKINDDLSSLSGEIYLNGEPLTSVIIPEGLTTLKRSAFAGCSKLTSVVIPEGIKRIPGAAFYQCTNLKSVVIPESVTSVWSNAFYGCKSLSEISLPKGLTNIANNAFENCINLTTVRLPSSLTAIDGQAFSGCTGLKDVYYGGSEEDWAKINIGSGNEPLQSASIHFESSGSSHTHSWGTEYTTDKEATCTEEGSESIHCTVCGEIKEDSVREIAKLAHTYGDWEIVKDATCTEAGSRKKICKACGDVVTEKIPATGHIWNKDYTVDKEPTNTEAGSKSIHCTVCNAMKEGSAVLIPRLSKELSGLTITGIVNKTYTGKEITQEFEIRDGSKKLVQDTDFTVSYQNNINTGTATVNINGIGSYTGTVTKNFLILPGKTTRGDMFNLANNVKVTWKEVPGAKYYKVYREGVTDPGESVSKPVIVTERLIGWDSKPGLTNGHAYRYRIVASLTGAGDSSGDSPLSYSKLMYRLKTVVIRSVKNTAPGKVTVKYDKTTSGDSYVLQYCERQDMVGAKTKVVLGAANTSYVIGGLKKGKTYYISIRVRKKVNGIDYYTTFGVAKKVKISK